MVFDWRSHSGQVDMLNFLLTVAFASVALPYFTIGSSVLIIILLALTLIFKFTGNTQISFKSNLALLLPVCYYLFLLTDNLLLSTVQSGFYEAEKRLALLALPLAFMLIPIRRSTFFWSMILFIMVALQLWYVVELEAILKFAVNHSFYNFWGEAFTWSWRVHRVYWSYLFIIAYCWLLYWPYAKYTSLRLATAFILGIFILQLLSKTFVPALIISTLLYPFWMLGRMPGKKWTLAIVIGMGILFTALIYQSQYVHYYLSQALNYEAFKDHAQASPDNGFAIRYHIWRIATDVLNYFYATGVGVNTAHPTLVRAYEYHSFVEGMRLQLNAHNQFIQVLLETGVFGLAFVCTIFAALFNQKNTYTHGKWPYIMLTLLFFMIESAMQSQKGLLMFVYLYCFYTCNYHIPANDGR